MRTIYRNTIAMVRQKCSEYRCGTASLDELKAAVWEAAQQIESSDENELRNSLQSIEGRLDMIQFTTENAKVFAATLPLVHDLEELMRKVM
jgi:hypothetical protein